MQSPDSNETSTNVSTHPALSISKSAEISSDLGTPGVADKGDEITYTFTVTNSGDVNLSDISVNDELDGLSAISSDDSGVLAPGLQREFTATYTVTQADIDAGGPILNTATATGVDPSDNDVSSDESNETSTDIPIDFPSLTIAKSAELTTDDGTTGVADVDDVITYTITVTNAGGLTISDVAVSDALEGLGTISTDDSGDLAPGDERIFTATYTVTQTDIDAGGPILNTASATGLDPSGDGVSSGDSNETSTDVVAAAADISLDKTAVLREGEPGAADDDGVAEVGDVVEYTFTVKNEGNVTLTSVDVDDPKVTGISPTAVSLAPGATQIFTAADYTVTQADVDSGGVYNEAEATGVDPDSVDVTADDDNNIPTVEAIPDVTVLKSGELTTDNGTVGEADEGDVITFTFTATNADTATGTASDVSVTDPLDGLSAVTPASVDALAPGESADFTATYTVTADDVAAGQVQNQASGSYSLPIPRGGVSSPPVDTPPSNVVVIKLDDPVQVEVTGRSSKGRLKLPVSASGKTGSVTLRDVITVTGFREDPTPRPMWAAIPSGTAVLYGPVAKRSNQVCTASNEVARVLFTPHNGTFATSPVELTKPGLYIWRVSTAADPLNNATNQPCGLAKQTTLVHRPSYGVVRAETGVGLDGAVFKMFGVTNGSLSIPALGIKVAVLPVQKRDQAIQVPSNVRNTGWLVNSAASGEMVGATVIAGHVSDEHDRPGGFYKLQKAKRGQVIKVRTPAGDFVSYRVTKVVSQSREKAMPRSFFSTTSAHKLVLITCTRKVTTGSFFHYTNNLIVIARPIT